ncbi:hypothetical protein PIB30_094035 [Stylosanthes scabra]|uniref:NB-ARC domain-containing protein n=1 Tax=Stylosanthes scabra TaxID=79078 RepID=A0ABU6TUS1_9FABA|nr:hypothetical protein [Stylosanthes scabra]
MRSIDDLVQAPPESVSQHDNKIDVIPLVGIGGLGKTTLAQMVYHDDSVKNHFNLQMWVCVSDDDRDFEVKRVIHQIVNVASVGDTRVDQNPSLEELLTLLKQILYEKRFLLVLDDIWNEESWKWELLRGHLESACSDMNSKGSKIIVTTRRKTVASIVGTKPPILLRGLPHKECWELFVKCAFREAKEAEEYPWLKGIGKVIIEKCKRVPLAITTLGCLLRSKQCDKHEWEKIRDSEIWELDAKDDGILPSLSYELIMLWMAHGLLQPVNNEEKEPEEIGELYIKKLLSISLLQLDEYIPENELSIISAAGLNELKMHDLIHDLAKSTMKKSTKDSDKTRTIIASQTSQESFVEWTSHEFKHLKVLHLEGRDLELLPDDCFAKVKHLRYLSLSECDMPEKLPGSICKLQILQSLDLSDCYNLLELPESIKNLVSLLILFLTLSATSFPFMEANYFQQLRCLFITNCENLVSPSGALGRLIVLKKLVIHNCIHLVNFEDEEEEEGKKHVIIDDLKLETFMIFESPKLKALPKWLKRSIKALRYMGIQGTGIEALPEWLPNATSLERLYINDCQGLSSLPDNMEQLQSLIH